MKDIDGFNVMTHHLYEIGDTKAIKDAYIYNLEFYMKYENSISKKSNKISVLVYTLSLRNIQGHINEICNTTSMK